MIQDELGFPLRIEQTILNHPNQQLFCYLFQRNCLLGTQKHRGCGSFARRLPDNMTSLGVPQLQPQSKRCDPISDQFYPRRLEFIEYLFFELRIPMKSAGHSE